MSSDRKEKRTGVACEECRKRKKKCDGLRPICTLCLASQRDCVYTGIVETRKRKEHDSEYVSDLEEQIATLRAQLLDLQRTQYSSQQLVSLGNLNPHGREDNASNFLAAAPEAIDNLFQGSSANTIGPNLSDELSLSSSAIDDLSTLIWRMNINVKGGPTFIGPAGNFCVPSSADGFVTRSRNRLMPLAELDHPIPDVCFDVGIKNNLLNLFFKHLNPIHQFLPPTVNLAPASYPFGDLSQTILHSAVFAAGALFSTVEKEREAGIEFATCIDISCVQACRDQPSLVMVQALSIAAWRELSLEHNSAAAIYLSMAGGLAVDLGLHVIGLDSLSESELSKSVLAENREQRVRTFWAFFLVDRIAATMLGRNCMIPWRRIDVPLLHSVNDLGLTVDENAFSHQCRLWQLHDHFMDQIYSFEFKTLQLEHRNQLLLSARAELLAFKQAMTPALHVPSFNSTTAPPAAVVFLHMSYQTSLLLIHRPYLREPPNSSSFTLALATMSSAATRITQYTQLFNKYYLKHRLGSKSNHALPFILHHVLTASITHLLLGTAHATSRVSLARRNLQICMDVLSSSERTWPIASRAIVCIQELAVHWKIVSTLPLKWCFVGLKDQDEHNPDLAKAQSQSDGKPKSIDDTVFRNGSKVVDDDMPTTLACNQGSLANDHFSNSGYLEFPPGDQEFERLYHSMVYDDGMPSWFDLQFVPDFSALQEAFDFPNFNFQTQDSPPSYQEQ